MEARTRAAESRAREATARAEAEIDAVRQRLARDVERRVDEGRARLLGAVLEVVDNLERAAATARAGPGVVAEGVELILRQVLGILSAEGVEPIETMGREFDPREAEAIGVEPVEPARDNHVVTEVRRGYRLGGAILRPARVIIGRAGEPQGPAAS
jgi:molecular chaperone GrpE